MAEYKLGRYSFKSKEEYDIALKELSSIKKITEQFSTDDPHIAKMLLSEYAPKTVIGRDFARHLEEVASNAPAEEIPSDQLTAPEPDEILDESGEESTDDATDSSIQDKASVINGTDQEQEDIPVKKDKGEIKGLIDLPFVLITIVTALIVAIAFESFLNRPQKSKLKQETVEQAETVASMEEATSEDQHEKYMAEVAYFYKRANAYYENMKLEDADTYKAGADTFLERLQFETDYVTELTNNITNAKGVEASYKRITGFDEAVGDNEINSIVDALYGYIMDVDDTRNSSNPDRYSQNKKKISENLEKLFPFVEGVEPTPHTTTDDAQVISEAQAPVNPESKTDADPDAPGGRNNPLRIGEEVVLDFILLYNDYDYDKGWSTAKAKLSVDKFENDQLTITYSMLETSDGDNEFNFGPLGDGFLYDEAKENMSFSSKSMYDFHNADGGGYYLALVEGTNGTFNIDMADDKRYLVISYYAADEYNLSQNAGRNLDMTKIWIDKTQIIDNEQGNMEPREVKME